MHHDWHSEQYVTDWIAHDVARDPERRPRLQQMLEMAPFPRAAAIEVLDVGAGYGAVSEEVLKRFPNARVTLQDYSQPMLAEAQRRLAPHAARLTYVTADLTDPAWPQAVGSPFDLAVSAIALHNLHEPATIFAWSPAARCAESWRSRNISKMRSHVSMAAPRSKAQAAKAG